MLAALLVAFQVVAAAADPSAKCSLSGTVVNSATGEPSNKVRLLAESDGSQRTVSFTSVTDAAGRFEITGLDPGRYRLRAQRNGFLETYYGARRSGTKGAVIALEPGESLRDLQIRLRPFGVISGTVRDSDGEPLMEARVTAFRFRYGDGGRGIEFVEEVRTDDLGQYRIPGLAHGQYLIRARAKGEEGAANQQILLPVLFPGVTDTNSATRIEVTYGSRIPGIDMMLPTSRVFRVRGVVAVPKGNVTSSNVWLSPHDSRGAFLGSIHASIDDKSGQFELLNVPPGSYQAGASFMLQEAGATHFVSGFERITVSNQDVNNFRIAIEQPVEVMAQVIVEGERDANLEGADVRLQPVDFGGTTYNHSLTGGQAAARMEVQRNRYLLQFRLPRQQSKLYLKAIRTASINVLTEGLTVNGPEKVEIILSNEAARVSGTVFDDKGKPIAGATAVIVPLSEPDRTDLIRDAITDQNGRFQMGSLAPGEYRLFAWQDVEPGIWYDPEFLRKFERQAQTVKLTAKGQAAVSITVAPEP